jgi:hypothetical protein
MAEIYTHTQPESLVTQAAEQKGIQGANGSLAETSQNLYASLNQVHADSQQRNSADSATNAQAMAGDKDSVTLAGKTSSLAESLQAYINKAGDFKDPAGRDLGNQFIAALRKERGDDMDDRKTDLQYAGRDGAPKGLQQEILGDSKNIADNVAELSKPNLSADARTNVLLGIEAGANAIAANVTEHGGLAGKDLKDAASESKVISADAAALLSGKLTPEQSKTVAADMASKAGLIQKEVGDIPNEVNYAQHDSQAIRAGADLEAVIKSAMRSQSSMSMHQLSGLLDAYHNPKGQGLLDTVVKDRQADLNLEPGYIAANNSDNANNNKQILDFSDPFKRH